MGKDVQPAGHSQQRQEYQSPFEPVQPHGVGPYPGVQPHQHRQQGHTAQGGCRQQHAVHIPRSVDQCRQVGNGPQDHRRQQRNHLHQPPRQADHRSQPHTGRSRCAARIQVLRRDGQAEQHHRQVDSLGRCHGRSQSHQQHQLPAGSRLLPQCHAQSHKQEDSAQHPGIGRKAARQLQRHGKQRHTGKQPPQGCRCHSHGRHHQHQVQQQIGHTPVLQHGIEIFAPAASQPDAGRLGPIVGRTLPGIRLTDFGGRIGGTLFQNLGVGLCLVGENADLPGFGGKMRCITGTHQQFTVRGGSLLTAPRAGQLIGCRQVGILVGGHQRRGHLGKTVPQAKPHCRHQHRQRCMEHRQQYRTESGRRQRQCQLFGQNRGPAAGIIGHQLDCQRGIQRGTVCIPGTQRHAVHFPFTGPQTQRAVPGHRIVQVHRQVLGLLGNVGIGGGEFGKGIVKNIEEVACRLHNQLPSFVGDVHHHHTGFVQLPVGAEFQTHPVKCLAGFQMDGLGQSILRQVHNLAVRIVEDFVHRLVAQPLLQIIAHPAAKPPDGDGRQQRRDQGHGHMADARRFRHGIAAFL